MPTTHCYGYEREEAALYRAQRGVGDGEGSFLGEAAAGAAGGGGAGGGAVGDGERSMAAAAAVGKGEGEGPMLLAPKEATLLQALGRLRPREFFWV